MLDTETMATSANAVVLTLGAVKFNPHSMDDPTDAFYLRLNVDQQLELGRKVDEGTLAWWSKQPADARDEAFSEDDRVDLNDAFDQFNKFLVGSNNIWAQGPVFDITILENLLHDLKRPVPWQFWQIRDSRTMFGLGWDPRSEVGQADLHNALADAYTQAKALQLLIQKLDLKKLGIRK